MSKLFKTRKDGLLARAQARKAAFGERHIEKRVVAFRCAAEDELFNVVFARERGETRFRVHDILTGEAAAASGKEGADNSTSYSAGAFDFSGLECPHCGRAHGYTRCGKCKNMVCDSRSQQLPGGEEMFRCAPSCGCQGTTVPLAEIKAADPKAQKMLTAQPPLLRLPRFK